MLFAVRREKGDITSELARYDMTSLTQKRLAVSLFGAFIGGISAGLLGIGGGAVIVPVLSVLMGLPMHAAVATSMFTMMFTASAGTAMNILQGWVNPYYAIALGAGMLIGAQFGSRLAPKVDSVQLKRVFGLILVFPLVKMMKLGQIWLDPLGTNVLASTIGDIIIWRDMRNNKGNMQNFPVDHNSDIFMYNLTTRTEEQVTTNEQGQFSAGGGKKSPPVISWG